MSRSKFKIMNKYL